MRSCLIAGQTDTQEDIFPGLSSAIEYEIMHQNITQFFVGNHGRFDLLAYRALRAAKRKFPHIRCFLVSSYPSSVAAITPPVGFDGVYCPSDSSCSSDYSLDLVNRAMLYQCDVLISALPNSDKLLKYAQPREKDALIRIVNLINT